MIFNLSDRIICETKNNIRMTQIFAIIHFPKIVVALFTRPSTTIIQFVCITNKLAHWPMSTMTNFTWFVFVITNE